MALKTYKFYSKSYKFLKISIILVYYPSFIICIFSSFEIFMLNFLRSANTQFQLYSFALCIDQTLRLFKLGSNGNGFFVFLIIVFLSQDMILPIRKPLSRSQECSLNSLTFWFSISTWFLQSSSMSAMSIIQKYRSISSSMLF